jgi:hypothetical protein
VATVLTSCFEGLSIVAESGMPATLELALVEEFLADDPENPGVGELSPTSGFADLTEVDWSGSTPYARITLTTGNNTDGVWTCTPTPEWNTGTATDGPTDVGSIALLTTNDELLGLWHARYYLNADNSLVNPIDLSTADATARSTTAIELFAQTVSVTV